ncbi:MAG: VWA domain-containing protein, partial [Verrucomicrobia bacterium]|nr:VWA domain-containing protein [Verrucomicrobiota bacterium]
MDFLSPLFFWGMFAVAAPVIIHLLQRKRVVIIPFSTLRFLKQIAAKTTRRSRIENLLLLLMRCAIFALIIFAATKPIMSARTAQFLGANVPRTVVLLVDNSLSMSYRAGDQTRLEAAKRQASVILDDLKPDDDIAIIAAHDRAQGVIAEPTVDHALARKALASVQATEARTDFAPALREARRILTRSTKTIKQVYLLTDNQESGWSFEPRTVFDDSWKQSDIKFVIIRTDNLAAVNSAVKQVTFRSPFVTSGGQVRGVATVENFSTAPLHDLLEIKIGEERVAQRPVDADPGSTVEVPFEFIANVAPGRAVQGVAKLQGDNLPGDDRSFFSLPVYQPPRVLVVEQQVVGEDRLHS